MRSINDPALISRASAISAAVGYRAPTAALPNPGTQAKPMTSLSSTSVSTPSDVTSADLVDYATAAARLNQAPDPTLPSSAAVWVVGVHAPMYTDGSPSTPSRLVDSYAVIFDAANGKMIDLCVGCKA